MIVGWSKEYSLVDEGIQILVAKGVCFSGGSVRLML